jgi:uncharacterized protein (TIGR00661 family)
LRILYAIQGTGNGHLSRARDIISVLQKKGDLDILISGIQADIELPFPIKYRFYGLSFIFGKKGGVDVFETLKKGNIRKLILEIKQLPIDEYDLIVNDFEPVSAWACYLKGKECVSLSHQAVILNKKSPQPKEFSIIGKVTLKNYAPTTAQYGFHFQQYEDSIYTPIIRDEIRKITPQNKNHYTVYLPAFSDEKIIKMLSEFPDIKWEVFSKHTKESYIKNNISISCINNEKFIESMAESTGVLCGAGFETPAEALFLKKKLMVIPMKKQFEQQCNAEALKYMGVPVIKNLKQKQIPKIKAWLESTTIIDVNYPNITEKIIDTIILRHGKKVIF